MRTTLLSFLLLISIRVLGQHDESFIYGTLTTVDGNSYRGCMRWNNEEVFWQDFFNSVKTENKYHSFVSREDILENIQMWFSDEKKDKKAHEDSEGLAVEEDSHAKVEKDLVHVWLCTFGDLRSITITGKETVDLELRDGAVVKVKGGSNDLGTQVKMLDKDLGELTLNWDKISKIEFSSTPKQLSRKFGEPLFGTVETTIEEFTGFIQWDQEERLATDLLNARTEDGEVSLPFANIESIAKEGSGSRVTLGSGRVLALSGTNDVNGENRGICINVQGVGRITVPWENFVNVRFSRSAPYAQPAYSNFQKPSKIEGKVIGTSGHSYTGTIAYDLDEEYDFEFIQGNSNGVEYAIPVKNISRIAPANQKSRITLKNGKTLTLGGTHDVAEYNSGVLVFTKTQNEPVYLKWSQVKEINIP